MIPALFAVAVHSKKRNFWTNKIRRDAARKLKRSQKEKEEQLAIQQVFVNHPIEETMEKELEPERQSVPLEEAAMERSVSRRLEEGTLAVFVSMTGAADYTPIVVTAEGTLQDLVDQARSQSMTPQLISAADVTVTVAGASFPERMLGTTLLSDIGVCAECVVEISSRKADIERLFEIFENPETTEFVFGYPTYQHFRNDVFHPHHSDFEEQFNWLQKRLKRLTEHSFLQWTRFDGQIRVVGIDLYLRDREVPESLLNWNAIAGMDELDEITIVKANVVGKVAFHQLPRKLTWLNMAGNRLTAVENTSDCPPHLSYVNLVSNDISDINPTILGEQLPPALLHDHRGNVRWTVSCSSSVFRH